MPSIRKKRGGKPKEKPITLAGSPALKRLIEEVRAEKDEPPTRYNRTYHRHNRS